MKNGFLMPDVLRRILRTSFSRLGRCYYKALEKDASLKGSIVVEFKIDAMGSVYAASAIGGTLGDATVKTCVAGVYKSLSFPEPEGGQVIVTHTTMYAPPPPSEK
jgi:hypothetical protein